MGQEQTQEVDLRDDPAMRRMNRRAERLNRRENAKKEDLAKDEEAVNQEMDDLTLEMKGEKDPKTLAKKQLELADLKDELKTINEKQKALTEKFNEKGERVTEKVLGPKQEKLDAKVAQFDAINKRLGEIEVELTELGKKGEDKTSDELRTEASLNTEKANLQEQLKSLEKKDNLVELKARQVAYKKMEDESKEGDLLTIAQLEDALNDPEVPLPVENPENTEKTDGKTVVKVPLTAEVTFDENNAPKEGKETISSKIDMILEGLAKTLTKLPNKDNTYEKYVYQGKAMFFQLVLMFGGESTKWAEKLSEQEKTNLEKGIGLKLAQKDGKTTIKWVQPDPEYQAPNKTVVAVFEKYFGADGIKDPMEKITPDMTLKGLEDSLKEKNQKDPYFINCTKLVTEIRRKNGVKDETLILTFLKDDGEKLLDADDKAMVAVQKSLDETMEALKDPKFDFKKPLEEIHKTNLLNKDTLFADFLRLFAEKISNTTIDTAVWNKVLSKLPKVDFLATNDKTFDINTIKLVDYIKLENNEGDEASKSFVKTINELINSPSQSQS